MVPENKQKRRYKQTNFIGLQNNRHPSQHTVGNVNKASGNRQQRLLQESIAETLSQVLGLPPRLQNCAPFIMLFRRRNRKKSTHLAPLIWILRTTPLNTTRPSTIFLRLLLN
jgi:hypothetical protein